MICKTIEKQTFIVIGKAGSTNDGKGFIQQLWCQANASFDQVSHLAKRNPDGSLCGVWGAMSDFSGSFLPWTDGFTKGLYLAGVECRDDAAPPQGWVKWVIPGFEYLCIPNASPDAFSKMIAHLNSKNIPLAGAIQEFTCPQTGKSELWFPIKKL